MRSKLVMLDLIMSVAKNDSRILAVYMNGSRVNKQIKEDIFQDYDVVYVVENTQPFIADKTWIDLFGERLYMQYPDENAEELGFDNNVDKTYGWLMQFKDGNRLDLHVSTFDYAIIDIANDSLVEILLDKQELLPKIPPSSDVNYHVKKPSDIKYASVCNEFWWCLNNVAKGCFREEWTYVQDMLNFNVRPQLFTMLSWYVGIQTNFKCSVGKSGKYLNQWLEQPLWNAYLRTFPRCEVNEIWDAVFLMCDLMDEIAKEVAVHLQFCYDIKEAEASRNYLEHVQTLLRNASEVYVD